jgi:hypothetical protein
MNPTFTDSYYSATDGPSPQEICYSELPESHSFWVSYEKEFRPSKFTNTYYGYKNLNVFLKLYSSIPDDHKRFHEQIRKDRSCIEYYDIEGKPNEGLYINKTPNDIIKDFLSARSDWGKINGYSNGSFDLEKHVLILDSSDATKISFHILIRNGYVFKNNSDMKIYINAFSQYIKLHNLPIVIDDSVYTSNRNFRMIDSHKPNSDRFLRRSSFNNFSLKCDYSLFFVTNIDPEIEIINSNYCLHPSTPLQFSLDYLKYVKIQQVVPTSKPKVAQSFSINPTTNKHLTEILEHLSISRFEIRDTWLRLMWIMLSYNFDSNTIQYFSSKASNYDEASTDAIILSFNSDKTTVTLGTLLHYLKEDVDHDTFILLSKPFITDSPKDSSPEIDKMFIIQPSDFIQTVIIPDDVKYALPIVFPPNIRSLAIHQYLGGGKTTSIIAFINSMSIDSKILILSPRISFAESITDEYNSNLNPDQTNFLCYTSFKSKTTMITSKRLVVSMESLHYLYHSACDFVPDLLVIDECQANLVQHTCIDTNGKNIENNISFFEKLCNHSKKIIWADAFLGTKTTNLINNFKIPTVLYKYTHKMIHRDLIFVPTLDKKDLLKKNLTPLDSMLIYILDSLGKDERNYIFVSSKQKLILWSKIISDTFPNKKILSYTGGSKIGNIKSDWATAQCVLTTSTITVGINFDLKDYFHNIFIYASAFSQNRVSDIIQSHFRVRHIINNQIFLFISTKKNKLLNTNYDSLYSDFDWKESYFKSKNFNFENASVSFKQLVIDNIYEQNMSTMNLDSMLNYYLKECNYTVKTDNVDVNINDIEFDLDIQEEILTPFDDIKLINEFEAMLLIRKRQQNNQLSNSEKLELDKKLFVSCFCNNNVAWVDQEHVAFFWSKWVNFGRTKIRMIRKEKQLIEEYTTIGKLYEKQCDDVSIAGIQKNRLLKIEWIRNICNDLGLKHSQDTKTIIPHNLVKKIHNRMILEEKNIRQCFEIRDQRKDRDADITFIDSVKLLNSIFNSFGYSKFVKGKRKQTRVDGKRVEVSDFQLQTSDKDFVKEGISCDTIYDYIDLMDKEAKRLLK